jgi:DNA-3-methyladenine glycosylase
MKPLPRDFYDRDTVSVARELLGKPFVCHLSGRPLYGRIVEVEAYQSDDEACHAYRGKTSRNQALFGPVGHTYVYLCYGIHFCLNIVARNTSKLPAGGVLIRAVAVSDSLEDLSTMRRIDGPGKLAKVLNITKAHNSINVTDKASQLVIFDDEPLADAEIVVTKRIGLSKGIDKLWRFLYK